jgi:hypothetical protein
LRSQCCDDSSAAAPPPLPAGRLRLQSGAKLKSLAGVLHLARAPQPGANSAPLSPMPLAAIVDDRVEVGWGV